MRRPTRGVALLFYPLLYTAAVFLLHDTPVGKILFLLAPFLIAWLLIAGFTGGTLLGEYFGTLKNFRLEELEALEATEDLEHTCPKCHNVVFRLEYPYRNWEYYCEHCHALVVPEELIPGPYLDPSEYMFELPHPRLGQPKLYAWVWDVEEEEPENAD